MDRNLALAIGQAIHVATAYYSDPDAKVKGMYPADAELRAKRLKEMELAEAWWLQLVAAFPRE